MQSEVLEKRDWLSPVDVSREYGFSISTLAKFRMSNKHLRYFKTGKYIKYKRSDIEDFLNANVINVEAA